MSYSPRALFTLPLLLSALLLAGCCDCDDDNLTSTPPGTPPGAITGIALCGHGNTPDIDVVDTATMLVAGTIVGAGGFRIVITPGGSKAYSTGGDSLLYISDVATRTLTNSFVPGVTVVQLKPIAISPDGSRVFTADQQGSKSCYAIDTANDTVVLSTALVADRPANAVVSSDGGFLYINDMSDVLQILPASLAIVGSETIASDTEGLALNTDDTLAYADSNTVSGGIALIDTEIMVEIGTVTGLPPTNAVYMELAKIGSRLYAVDGGTELHVIESLTNTLVQSVTLSTGAARAVTTTPDGATILVATTSGLIRLDATTLLETGFLAGNYQSVVAN